MSKDYDDYIRIHKACVALGYMWISVKVYDEVMDILPDLITFSRYELSQQILSHDDSKYSCEEYGAYDNYFYKNNSCLNADQIEANFNKAWLHHIHDNPHHWQHWVLIEDDGDSSGIGLDMPDYYILEMICDWWAFSWKKFIDNGTRNVTDLREVFEWYDNHKNIMILSKTTREKVENILKVLDSKLSYENQ